MEDKREECGCHKTCTVLEHVCDNPCSWPKCLNEEETKELVKEIMNDPDL